MDPDKQRAAHRHTVAGAQAVASQRYDDGIREYKAALALWPHDHGAWYGLTVAHARKLEWTDAAAAMERAAGLEPRNAGYQQVHGMMLYEATVQQARAAQAAAQGKQPDEIVVDEHALDHKAALAKLLLSAHLDRSLWRTHFYIGRIHRQRGDARAAAEAFDEAVRGAPPEASPYVALVELYRRWGYVDEAIAIARLGATHVAAPDERADVLYMLGFAHDEKREDAAALEAYTKALAAKPDLAPALMMRAQVYLRLKNTAAAKADLEAYLAHPRATAWQKATAQRNLADLTRKKP
jgi:tetratricopeptide (TPR) repeat protein